MGNQQTVYTPNHRAASFEDPNIWYDSMCEVQEQKNITDRPENTLIVYSILDELIDSLFERKFPDMKEDAINNCLKVTNINEIKGKNGSVNLNTVSSDLDTVSNVTGLCHKFPDYTENRDNNCQYLASYQIHPDLEYQRISVVQNYDPFKEIQEVISEDYDSTIKSISDTTDIGNVFSNFDSVQKLSLTNEIENNNTVTSLDFPCNHTNLRSIETIPITNTFENFVSAKSFTRFEDNEEFLTSTEICSNDINNSTKNDNSSALEIKENEEIKISPKSEINYLSIENYKQNQQETAINEENIDDKINLINPTDGFVVEKQTQLISNEDISTNKRLCLLSDTEKMSYPCPENTSLVEENNHIKNHKNPITQNTNKLFPITSKKPIEQDSFQHEEEKETIIENYENFTTERKNTECEKLLQSLISPDILPNERYNSKNSITGENKPTDIVSSDNIENFTDCNVDIQITNEESAIIISEQLFDGNKNEENFTTESSLTQNLNYVENSTKQIISYPEKESNYVYSEEKDHTKQPVCTDEISTTEESFFDTSEDVPEEGRSPIIDEKKSIITKNSSTVKEVCSSKDINIIENVLSLNKNDTANEEKISNVNHEHIGKEFISFIKENNSFDKEEAWDISKETINAQKEVSACTTGNSCNDNKLSINRKQETINNKNFTVDEKESAFEESCSLAKEKITNIKGKRKHSASERRKHSIEIRRSKSEDNSNIKEKYYIDEVNMSKIKETCPAIEKNNAVNQNHPSIIDNEHNSGKEKTESKLCIGLQKLNHQKENTSINKINSKINESTKCTKDNVYDANHICDLNDVIEQFRQKSQINNMSELHTNNLKDTINNANTSNKSCTVQNIEDNNTSENILLDSKDLLIENKSEEQKIDILRNPIECEKVLDNGLNENNPVIINSVSNDNEIQPENEQLKNIKLESDNMNIILDKYSKPISIDTWGEEKEELISQLKISQQTQNMTRYIVKELFLMFSCWLKERKKEDRELKECRQKLIIERDQALEDLRSVENAFSDLHRRYEKSKTMIEEFKKNEDRLKEKIQESAEKLQQQTDMYELLKKRSEDTLEEANIEILNSRKGTETEVAVLKAKLRKAEMKANSLQKTLEQKVRENTELSSICEELIAKVGSK